MHASMAYVNGAVSLRYTGTRLHTRQLQLLNALLSAATAPTGGESLDEGKSRDEHQAENEAEAETVSRPGSFKNDPDDASNPNEVRERHLRNVNRD